MAYKRILAAVDLSDTTDQVTQKASGMSRTQGAEIHLVHVVEPLALAYGTDMPLDISELQTDIQTQAQIHLTNVGKRQGVPAAHRHLLTGRPESEIPDLAAELGADLIVLGSHARWGLALLLGSTTDGILHSAKCDVLAVRVDKQD